MTVVDFTTGTCNGQTGPEPQRCPATAGAADFPDGHLYSEAQVAGAVGEHNSQPTSASPVSNEAVSAGSDFPDGCTRPGAHTRRAVGEHNLPAPAIHPLTPIGAAPVLALNPWADSNAPLLALLADSLDDLERTRIANENRLRQLTRNESDKDGEERGFGLTLDQPEVAQLAAMVTALRCGEKPRKNGCCLEHDATKNLQRAVRKHPLGPWVKATIGIGEKQGARLLAAIGDPYWNTLHDRPRRVSELWQYAGHGDPARSRRRKGQRVEYSPTAKTRTWLIAVSCIKHQASPYRSVYERRRAATGGRLHATDCVRCGPSGHPAVIGTPWSDGHGHADALRVVGKEILRDLWTESKRLHGEQP